MRADLTAGSVSHDWSRAKLSPRLKLRHAAAYVADVAYATYFWGRGTVYMVLVCGGVLTKVAIGELGHWGNHRPMKRKPTP